MENQEIPPPSPTRPVNSSSGSSGSCNECDVSGESSQSQRRSVSSSFHQLSLSIAGGAGVSASPSSDLCPHQHHPPTRSQSRLSRSTPVNSISGGSGRYHHHHRVSSVSAATADTSVDTVTLSDDWQSYVTTIRERNALMFNNDLMSDVRFMVGGSGSDGMLVPAHKYVLSIGSSVFYAMFNGALSNCDEDEIINIPDIEPQAFLTLLRYLYSDEVLLEQDTALTTLYAAKKYLVPKLARECVSYLERTLTADNACLFLAQSMLFDEEGLTQRCWQVIDAQAELALMSSCFTDVDHHTLVDIISRDTLNVREIFVFRACVSWADAECQRRGLQPTSDNKRTLLGDALFLVRMPLIDVKEFADVVTSSGLLTTEETCTMFKYHHASNKPHIPFIPDMRGGLQLSRVSRFQTSALRSNQWRYRGRCDSIQFSVDRRIFLAGYGLYGTSQRSGSYHVLMELKLGQKTLARHEAEFHSDVSSSSSKIYELMFPHPQQIEPELFYTASVVLTGTELSFFGQDGLDKVQSNGVTFTFQASQESTNGTGVQGGQIPHLIYYLV